MLRIYIARHGQDEDNAAGILNGHRDMPLTERGCEQARSTAQRMREHDICPTVVYCSPLRRARVTAEIISQLLNLPEPQVMRLLIERDFGVMTGVPISEVRARCAPYILETEKVTYMLAPEGAETFPVLLQRAHRALREIQSQHSEGNVLLVAHGDIGKMLYAAYYHLPWEDVLKKFHFDNTEVLLLAPNSPAEDAHVVRHV